MCVYIYIHIRTHIYIIYLFIFCLAFHLEYFQHFHPSITSDVYMAQHLCVELPVIGSAAQRSECGALLSYRMHSSESQMLTALHMCAQGMNETTVWSQLYSVHVY